uniref:Uncharacterized protein n=1 Tax=Parascaris univalens TaxID=6257 RepID=A0A915B225_PARUN
MTEKAVPLDYFLEAFELSNLQITFACAGSLLFTTGFMVVVFSVVLEYVILRRDSEKALRMKDDMMAPPRCKGKAEELGLTEQTDWKDYFARDEPFHEID